MMPTFKYSEYPDILKRYGLLALGMALLCFNSSSSLELISSKGGDLAEYMLWIDQTLINAVIVVMTWMVCRRHFPIAALPLMLALGELIYDQKLFISDLHQLLNGFDVYRHVFGRRETLFVNPQYGMITVYALLWMALFAQVVLTKYRTFDRVAALVTATSVIATFILFHFFLVSGINTAIDNEKRVLASIYAGGSADFDRQCEALKARCFHIAAASPSTDVRTGQPIDPVIARTTSDIAERQIRLATPYLWSETSLEHGESVFWVAAVATANGHLYLAVSGADFQKVVRAEELQFEFQSTIAHAIWLVIFICLVAIHRKSARKRMRTLLPSNAFSA